MAIRQRGKLIPFQSTHFQCMETETDERGVERLYTARLTKGKIYPILQWNKGLYQDSYSFKDEYGTLQEWVDYWGIEDISFEKNLEEILK